MRRAMKVSGLGITATVRLALEALLKQAESTRILREEAKLKPPAKGRPYFFLGG